MNDRIYIPSRQGSVVFKTMGEGRNDVTIKKVKDPAAPRCHAGVSKYEGLAHWYRQCNCVAKSQDADGNWWCGKHDDAAEARYKARSDAASQRFTDKWAKERNKLILVGQAENLARVLKEIMDGHNDPRAMARETLEKLEKQGLKL